jgi:O-antigen ligase
MHEFKAAPSTPTAADYLILVALAAGSLGCVLAVLPFRSFDLDRFFAPKELAFHGAALIAGIASFSGVRRLSITRTDAALGAWLALSFVSAVFATNHYTAVRAFTLSFSSAMVFWSARRLGARGLGRALAAMMAAAIVIGALTALAQAYGIKMEFATLSRAPGGTFGNRNFMAHLAAAGIPLLLWRNVAARSRIGWAISMAGLCICAVAIVLSRTRAAWLALMIWGVLAVIAVWSGPSLFGSTITARRLWSSASAVVAGVALALVLPNTLDWRSDNPYLDSVKGVVNYQEGSGAGRLKQYANSARMAEAHPVLGVGPGNWPVVYPAFARPDDPSIAEATGMAANPWPSSDWIAALSERGLPATVFLLAAVLAIAAAGWRSRDIVPDDGRRLAALAGASALGIAVIEGGFDAVLLLPGPAIVVWAVAGALVPRGQGWREIDLTFGRRAAVTLCCALFCGGAVALSYARISAMPLYNVGTVAALERATRLDPGAFRIQLRAADTYLARGQCKEARVHAIAARDLFPHAPGPKRVLGQCRS